MTKPATPHIYGVGTRLSSAYTAGRNGQPCAPFNKEKTSAAYAAWLLGKTESDRARLIEALGDAERRFKIASEEDISDSTFSEWAHEARSLLRELEE